ncbi:methylglutaconyl-CoA hydratase, mitochondrial-like [Panonychus citri]|uniref:methylglutaconyl-CoA hydratase, mitochondrial-like n=1 Tax=Panonychus citri TaxID=50023 RepID=UPI0023071D86|nr:methylglutaconyl-CoA hydratase, mitochondrial-like [Panonychus citri]
MLIRNNLPRIIFSSSLRWNNLNCVRLCSSSNRRDEFIESADKQQQQQLKVDRLEEPKGLCILSLNDEKKRNALSGNLVSLLEDNLANLHNDRTIRCLIVRSLVKNVFCAGADLKERFKMEINEVGPFVERLRNLTNSLANLPYPTIAAIEGAAFGGGLEMALACDLRVASPRAKLGLVEAKLAIIPGAGGTQRLPRLIGLSKAKDLIFTGRKVNGKEAISLGLIDYLAEEDDDEAAFKQSIKLAQEICNSGPLGVRWAKFAITKGIEVDLNAGMAFEKLAYAQVTPTKDRVEGMKSFIEKRSPTYKGE